MEKEKNTTVKKTSDCKREITVEIPVDQVDAEYNRILARFSQKAKLRGFRPGKAPKDMIKQVYDDEIKNSLIDSLVPKALDEEFKAQNLYSVATPVVQDISVEEGQSLRFKVLFEMWPEFELPDVRKIKLEKRDVSVNEEDIENSLKELQKKSAQYLPAEGRGVRDGDYVVAQIKGKDTKTKRFLPSENSLILAGHPENEKILNENLIGMKVDEEKNFVIEYSTDHHNKKLAGKNISYNLKVLSIKEKKLSEINDDFAKDLGDYENLKELREKIKEEIMQSKKTIVRNEMVNEIMRQVSDTLSLELPESVLNQEQIEVLKRWLSNTPSYGSLNKEEIESLKEKAKLEAKKNITNHLILKKIIEKENLQVSENEYSEELESVARLNKVPLEKVINSIQKEGKKEDIVNNILLRKAVDFLVKNVIIS